MQGTVLIADADRRTVNTVRTCLASEGYQVEAATDGEDALKKTRQLQPDLLILETALPGLNGWEVCRLIRRASDVPLIFVSERADEIDRVLGLELGADDYVAKPFNPRELVARVNAVMRRSQAGGDGDVPLEFGGVRVDPARREVRVAGALIPMRMKEFDLLYTLARKPGRVVSRDALATNVWGAPTLGSSRTVDVHVALLRQKLAGGAVAIESVRGVGYRLTQRGE